MNINDAIMKLLAIADDSAQRFSPDVKQAYATASTFVAENQPAEDQALTDNDYQLIDGAAWFTVKNISVRIHSNDEGVTVDLYPRELETNNALASAYAFFSEAENELEAYAKENDATI